MRSDSSITVTTDASSCLRAPESQQSLRLPTLSLNQRRARPARARTSRNLFSIAFTARSRCDPRDHRPGGPGRLQHRGIDPSPVTQAGARASRAPNRAEWRAFLGGSVRAAPGAGPRRVSGSLLHIKEANSLLPWDEPAPGRLALVPGFRTNAVAGVRSGRTKGPALLIDARGARVQRSAQDGVHDVRRGDRSFRKAGRDAWGLAES